MTTVAVIPARYASTRFPGKPLANDTGKFLIQHVWQRVRQASRIDRVIIATDDDRISQAVNSFGGEVCMTRADHPCGTDRVAEVASKLGSGDQDWILNVQGDEPEIDPAVLDRLIGRLVQGSGDCSIGTLAAPFDDAGPRTGPGSPLDPYCVKVVVDAKGRALYFSRSLIPFPRETGGEIDRPSRWMLHMGVYLFRADVLRAISGAAGRDEGCLSQTEALEQLGWMERGFGISVLKTEHAFAGIDTPQDYSAFVQRVRAGATGSSSPA